jgi:hypothetical protein
MLVAMLFTFLGAAVFVIAILAAMIQRQNETIRGLREKMGASTASHSLHYYSSHGGSLPVIATSRKSMGSGFILTLKNESSEDVILAVALANPGANRRKTVSVTVEAQHTAEFGHFDEWKLTDGDTVVISLEGFNSVTMRLR